MISVVWRRRQRSRVRLRLLVQPAGDGRVPVSDLRLREPVGDLVSSRLLPVRAVNDVTTHVDSEVTADGAGGRVLGLDEGKQTKWSQTNTRMRPNVSNCCIHHRFHLIRMTERACICLSCVYLGGAHHAAAGGDHILTLPHLHTTATREQGQTEISSHTSPIHFSALLHSAPVLCA